MAHCSKLRWECGGTFDEMSLCFNPVLLGVIRWRSVCLARRGSLCAFVQVGFPGIGRGEMCAKIVAVIYESSPAPMLRSRSLRVSELFFGEPNLRVPGVKTPPPPLPPARRDNRPEFSSVSKLLVGGAAYSWRRQRSPRVPELFCEKSGGSRKKNQQKS